MKQNTAVKEVFENPDSLAKWVINHIVDALSFEEDCAYVPQDKLIMRYNLSDDQIARCASEFAVQRLFGALMAAKQYYESDFMGSFIASAIKYFMEARTTTQSGQEQQALEEVINTYTSFWDGKDQGKFASYYVDRVYYDQNTKADIIANHEIADLGIRSCMRAFDVMNESYMQAMFGLPPELANKLYSAFNKTE